MKDIHKDIFIFEQKWRLDIYTTQAQFRKGMFFHLRKYPIELVDGLNSKPSEIWASITSNRKILHFYNRHFEVKGYRDIKIVLTELLVNNYEKVISHNP